MVSATKTDMKQGKMIEIKLYSAIGDPTHFHASRETEDESGNIQRFHTPRDQAFFMKNRMMEALRASGVVARESSTAAGSFSIILDSPLTARQAESIARYFMPYGIEETLHAAGALK